MDAKRVLILISIIVLTAGLALYFGLKEPQPIRLGYLGTISGKFAAMGASARNGALLAIEEINASGGVNNRPIELQVMDDGGDPAVCLEAARELYQDGIRTIIGPFTTASATKILPYINQDRILTIGPANAGENLANADDFFIKLFPSTKMMGELTAQLAVRMNLSTAAVITDHRNKVFGDTMIAGFKAVYEGRGKQLVDQVEYYSNEQISHFDLAEIALRKHPDGVFIISSPIDTAMLAQNLKKNDPDVVLFTSAWAISRELIENGGPAAEGMRFYVPFISNDQSERFLKFKHSYEARFSEAPTHVSIFNYEAVRILKRVLEHAEATDAVMLKKHLLGIQKFEGMQSDFTINENGDAQRALFLHEIRNQSFQPIMDQDSE
ncbi:MAG: amino acid ABC transporter substrate-binding protein [Desulfobacteraceae bacterium]|nr:MAG: amino acid ABC transporter substrate-binding protein [Desulfobacteraceae bacterium]